MAAAAYFWNQYLDKKDNTPMEKVDLSEMEVKSPAYYAVLPFLPIIGVFVFNGETLPGITLDIYTIVVLSISLACWSTTSLNVSTVSKRWKILKPVTKAWRML